MHLMTFHSLQSAAGLDLGDLSDFTRYCKDKKNISDIIDMDASANWAVYPERGSNEGYFINIEIHQALDVRCPIAVLRVHEESLTDILPLVGSLIVFLDLNIIKDIFSN